MNLTNFPLGYTEENRSPPVLVQDSAYPEETNESLDLEAAMDSDGPGYLGDHEGVSPGLPVPYLDDTSGIQEGMSTVVEEPDISALPEESAVASPSVHVPILDHGDIVETPEPGVDASKTSDKKTKKKGESGKEKKSDKEKKPKKKKKKPKEGAEGEKKDGEDEAPVKKKKKKKPKKEGEEKGPGEEKDKKKKKKKEKKGEGGEKEEKKKKRKRKSETKDGEHEDEETKRRKTAFERRNIRYYFSNDWVTVTMQLLL